MQKAAMDAREKRQQGTERTWGSCQGEGESLQYTPSIKKASASTPESLVWGAWVIGSSGGITVHHGGPQLGLEDRNDQRQYTLVPSPRDLPKEVIDCVAPL